MYKLPHRAPDADKFACGRALLICGSERYVGAPFFAALSCVKAGCGLTYLSVPDEIFPILAGKLNEPIFIPRDEISFNFDAYLIGCGLGRDADELCENVILNAPAPTVVDADALYFLSKNQEMLKSAKGARILTPHKGEWARFNCANPAGFAKEYNCVLVLKGAPTRIYFPDGSMYENTTGNCGMAKGGSGDVLAGMICAFLAQGLKPEDAATSGVYYHGYFGDLAREEFGTLSMTPTDIINKIKL